MSRARGLEVERSPREHNGWNIAIPVPEKNPLAEPSGERQAG